jgi:hypothetical protein
MAAQGRMAAATIIGKQALPGHKLTLPANTQGCQLNAKHRISIRVADISMTTTSHAASIAWNTDPVATMLPHR